MYQCVLARVHVHGAGAWVGARRALTHHHVEIGPAVGAAPAPAPAHRVSSRRRGSARLRFAHPPRWAGSGVVPAGALRAASDAFGTRRRDARVARRIVRPVYDRARATRWNPTRRRGRAVGVSDRDDHHRRGMELENPAARSRRARARVPSARDAPRNTPVAFTGTTTHPASRLMRDASASSSPARSSSARIPPRLLGFFPPPGPHSCDPNLFTR